jgi:hypothetical protein
MRSKSTVETGIDEEAEQRAMDTPVVKAMCGRSVPTCSSMTSRLSLPKVL